MEKYKYKSKSPQIKAHKDWLECTGDEKERLEKQFPNRFLFEEIKQPEPTPSMAKKANEEKKDVKK